MVRATAYAVAVAMLIATNAVAEANGPGRLFLERLAAASSDISCVSASPGNCYGITQAVLVYLGYKHGPSPDGWVPANPLGLSSDEELWADPGLQEKVTWRVLRDQWSALAPAADMILGARLNGVPVTAAGLLAASHVAGAATVIAWLRCPGGPVSAKCLPDWQAEAAGGAAALQAALVARLHDFADIPMEYLTGRPDPQVQPGGNGFEGLASPPRALLLEGNFSK